ncbi:MAG: helix-turn-helix domain-containing protein [Candidatus Heimdallarchaeota archaeon]|nr:MAG: helix-turn-helix domain-containing protein [Candidatus Heimdallarchaeota archaeon]
MSVQETMTKERLITQTKSEFHKAGYSLWNENFQSNAFDFIAKKTDLMSLRPNPKKIITKVVVDLDFFKKQTSIDLQLISKLISGCPLLISHSATRKHIKKGTLYRRHNISAISLKTLQMFLQYERGLESAKISKFAHRGGVYVNLSKEKFKTRRKQLQLDMTILAKKVGISRQSLYKYEKGERFPRTQYFKILSNILGTNLDVPLNILENQFKDICQHTLKDYKQPRSNLQKEITNYLADKEFDVLWFKSEPFDGLSKPITDDSSSKSQIDTIYPVITGVTSSNDENDSDRLLLIKSLSQFLQKKALWFLDDDDNLDNLDSFYDTSQLTVINISDLEGMGHIDFKNILKKRKKPDIQGN